jgi:hypothetical protein
VHGCILSILTYRLREGSAKAKTLATAISTAVPAFFIPTPPSVRFGFCREVLDERAHERHRVVDGRPHRSLSSPRRPGKRAAEADRVAS